MGQSILQVQSVTKTDTFSTSNYLSIGGAAVTGLAITITPRNIYSTFYIISHLTVGTGTGFIGAWIARGSTPIGIGAAASNRIGVGTRMFYNNAAVDESMCVATLDSPATSNAITYNVYICSEAVGNTAYLNRTEGDTDNNTYGARSASSLTVFEIGGP